MLFDRSGTGPRDDVGVEPVLGAFSVAGEKPFAAQTFGGEFVALVNSEGGLPVLAHHLGDRLVDDVAEKIVIIDKMVARVEVSVVIDYGIAATDPRECADYQDNVIPERGPVVPKVLQCRKTV